MNEFNPYRCVLKDKDDLQPQLTGVYHTEGLKVATDAHTLVVIKSEYPSKFEGKIITKKGVVIKKRFPLYESVIPSLFRCKKYSIDLQKLKDTIIEATIALESNKLTYISITDEFYVKISHAKLFLSFLKVYKTNTVYIHTPKDKKQLEILQARSGDNVLICTYTMSSEYHNIINNNLTTKI